MQVETGEGEFIDKSHWLPLKIVHQYTDFAVEMGRKIYNGGSILPGKYDKLPVEWLADDMKILSESHKQAGINFRVICDCSGGRISAYDVIEPQEVAGIDPVFKKIAIEMQLNAKDKHLVRRIAIYPVYQVDYQQFPYIAGRIVEAFDSLENAMKKDNIIKAVDNLRRNRQHAN